MSQDYKFREYSMDEGLRSVKVTFSNGDTISTSMSAGLSDDEIRNYYKIGKSFNIGNAGKDKMAKVKKVEILAESLASGFNSPGGWDSFKVGDEVVIGSGNGYWDISRYPQGGDFKRFKKDTTGKVITGSVKHKADIRVELSGGTKVVVDRWKAIISVNGKSYKNESIELTEENTASNIINKLVREVLNESGNGMLSLFDALEMKIDNPTSKRVADFLEKIGVKQSQAKKIANAFMSYKSGKETKEKAAMDVMEAATKYDIGYAWKGNGLTIYNRKETEHGDFKTLAVATAVNKIKWFQGVEYTLPSNIKKKIEKQVDLSFALRHPSAVNENQRLLDKVGDKLADMELAGKEKTPEYKALEKKYKELDKKYNESIDTDNEDEVDEMTATGAVGAYQTPGAFSKDSSSSEKKEKNLTKLAHGTFAKSISESLLKEDKFSNLAKELGGNINPETLTKVMSGKIKLSPTAKKEFDSFMKDLKGMLGESKGPFLVPYWKVKTAELEKQYALLNNSKTPKEKEVQKHIGAELKKRGITVNEDSCSCGCGTCDEAKLNEVKVTRKELEKGKYGSAHSNAQHFSKIDGEEYTWNYVLVKNGSYEVTTDPTKATSIAISRFAGKQQKTAKIINEKKLPKSGSADFHQHKIALDTVKNPMKSLMGGPSEKEAIDTLKRKFGYSDSEIAKLQESINEGMDLTQIKKAVDSGKIEKLVKAENTTNDALSEGPIARATTALLKYVEKTPEHLTDLIKFNKDFRGIHFKDIMKSAENLNKAGKVKYDGDMISLSESTLNEAPQLNGVNVPDSIISTGSKINKMLISKKLPHTFSYDKVNVGARKMKDNGSEKFLYYAVIRPLLGKGRDEIESAIGKITKQYRWDKSSETFRVSLGSAVDESTKLNEGDTETINKLVTSKATEIAKVSTLAKKNGFKATKPNKNAIMAWKRDRHEIDIYFNDKDLKMSFKNGNDDSTGGWELSAMTKQDNWNRTFDLSEIVNEAIHLDGLNESLNENIYGSDGYEKWADGIKKGIKAQYVDVGFSTLGGEERASVMFTIGLDPKESWNHNILQNSRYGKFHLGADGVLELHSASWRRVAKFRKSRVKSVADVIAKINKWMKASESMDTASVNEASVNKITVSPVDIKKIAKLTDYNDHNAARLYIMKVLVDNGINDSTIKKVRNSYVTISMIHKKTGSMPHDAMQVRSEYDKILQKLLQMYVTNAKDVWGAL